MPLGSERSSGSAVRFPVITTLLMLVAATAPVPFGFVLVPVSGPCRSSSNSSFESRPAPGHDLPAAWSRPRWLRLFGHYRTVHPTLEAHRERRRGAPEGAEPILMQTGGTAR